MINLSGNEPDRNTLELSKEQVGYFLFSLDTELATGHFDFDRKRKARFSTDGSRERQSINRLIDLFEEFNIVGTWAIVGHLFHNQCQYCENCPLMDWRGKYSSFDEVYGSNNPLWYGDDIVESILTRGPRQEIAFHGFSHKIFDETQMSICDAELETKEWIRLASTKEIIPMAVTFPRNLVGHLDALREAGFICYRCDPQRHWLIQNRFFGRYVKAIDQIFGLSKIPIFGLENPKDHGLVPLFSSQCFFDLNRPFEHFLDALNLHNLRLKRIIRGVEFAAKEKKMLHIWAHPCDFKSEKDFMKLRYLLNAVSGEIKQGNMKSVGMTEMAKIIIAINNHSSPDNE